MISQSESLILGNGAQLSLIQVDDAGLPADVYARNEASGRFTGERIFSTNPKLYHAIAALLARDLPYREISEICSVSTNTVCAVCLREGVPIETIRERVGRVAFDVAFLSIEAARDMLADPARRVKLSAKELILLFGIATQNAQLLLGGATSRMDTVPTQPAPGHDDYLAYVRKVTGLGGETAPAKEGPTTAIEIKATVTTDQPK